jgi:hypothetical protein
MSALAQWARVHTRMEAQQMISLVIFAVCWVLACAAVASLLLPARGEQQTVEDRRGGAMGTPTAKRW